jgi:5-methyltetrahydropteroyltriglutamate--homocysteine methyltransferase
MVLYSVSTLMLVVMKIEGCYVSGVMPRSETLITAYRRLASGRETYESLKNLALDETRETIKIQQEAGLSHVAEGQLLWHDLFRPFTESVEGLKTGPLSRWFDNNVFYKKPVIVSRLKRRAPLLEGYLFTELVNNLAWKLTTPEPYTFYLLSEDRAYSRIDEAVYDIAEILSAELRGLGGGQPTLLQLTASCLATRKLSRDEVEVVRESVRMIRKEYRGSLMLHLPFVDASTAFPWILDVGADIIGLDPYVSKVENLSGYSFSGYLGVGAIDSRTSYLEPVEYIKRVTESVGSAVSARAIHLTTSADMEFLPRGVAFSKLKRMAEAYRTFRTG